MELFIKTLDGTSHRLIVNPQDTVGSLKTQIHNLLKVPVHEQKLMFVNGKTTTLSDDTKPVCYYGLQSGSHVSLLIVEPPIIQVFLRNVDGQTSTYDIKPNETVNDFKRRVEQREGVPVSQRRFIHEGKEMTTGKLSDYNVRAHSTIYMTLRLRGG
ncbi:polyubiquitin-B-like [Mugil cephalus]|uniref:polyubiquitin-B-like n=1 Tax=Mugil cephalus TaxID=48193 RepID=UPI001FB5FA9D|nr:polyubiquitin-B-like [Mugil cephalus]XP_047447959.1 polyubiquitin-B-like [Mugil cephalus]